MSALNLISERYEREARLYPALFLIAPLVVCVVAMLSLRISGLQTIGAALIGFGGSFLLTQLARDEGKKKEPFLYQSWGGMPSVAIFRHGNARVDRITKARYHKQLSSLVKGSKSPTQEDEEADITRADETYLAWSHYLRSNTRDTKKYPLIFQENVNFGYRRNVWGLRTYGIAINIACVLTAGFRLWVIYKATGSVDGGLLAAIAMSVGFLALWIFRITPTWVRVPADAYAERLVEALETLGVKLPSEKKK